MSDLPYGPNDPDCCHHGVPWEETCPECESMKDYAAVLAGGGSYVCPRCGQATPHRHDSSDYLAAQRAALTARGMSPDEVERAMHPVMSFLASASDSGEYIDGCHCDRCTIARMREALIDIRDNWDHDGDAHKYGTPCRCCTAEKALS
jgi:hypothetical protein